MSSAESHLNLLDSVVRSAENLCKGETLLFRTQKEGQRLVLALKDLSQSGPFFA